MKEREATIPISPLVKGGSEVKIMGVEEVTGGGEVVGRVATNRFVRVPVKYLHARMEMASQQTRQILRCRPGNDVPE